MNQNIQKNEQILFVSDLPRETNEDDLYDFFKNYHLTSAKVQRSKTNTFAQVFFENSDSAQKARKDLNGEILTPKYSEKKKGKPVRICKFEPKSQVMESIKDSAKSLLVKNLDRDITAKEFYKMFEEFGEIKSSKLEVDENALSRGYGYVYFNDAKSADLAKQKLNGKEVKGLKLEIVNLIPSKSKDNTRNNIYVKNIPKTFTDEDLRQLFSKYGEITSAVVSKDDKGQGKGFGFVCFSNPLNAVQACKELKEKNLSFPGLPPLYVNFLMKRDERMATFGKREEQDGNNSKFLAILTDVSSYGMSESELENEVRLFIKVVLLQEYFPKKIEINMMNRSAIVTMNSSKDLAEFMRKYPESSMVSYLKFLPVPYVEQPNLPDQAQKDQFFGNPLVNMFQNLSLYNKPTVNPMNPMGFPPQMPPMNIGYPMPQSGFPNFQNKFGAYPQNQRGNYNPNYKNKNRNVDTTSYFNNRKPQKKKENEDPALVEEAGAQIYELIEKIYPDDAGKITGMIIDLGLEEMQTLLTQKEKLSIVIEEAHEMLHSNN